MATFQAPSPSLQLAPDHHRPSSSHGNFLPVDNSPISSLDFGSHLSDFKQPPNPIVGRDVPASDSGRLFDQRRTFDSLGDSIELFKFEQLGDALQTAHSLNDQGKHISREIIYGLLQLCAKEQDLVACRRLHSIMVAHGLDSVATLGDHLIRIFASCGSLQEATSVFCKISKPSIHSWQAIISAHVTLGESGRALELYHLMQQEGIQANKFIFSCILKACSTTGDMGQGKLIHDQIIESELEADVVVGTALIDMYAKCGNLEEARKIFDNLPYRDAVTWDAMITGYAAQEHGLSALELFEKMQLEALSPDIVTFSCILKACGSVRAVGKGKLIHKQIIGRRLESEVVIGSSLVDMYAKCASLEDARKVFDELPNRNSVTWGAMIAGYAEQGCSLLALELFDQMQRQPIDPDKVVFSCALKACGSIGAIEQGKLIHSQLIRSGLEIDKILGNILVDMYAKCGNLEEAHKVFHELPSQDVVSWGALISGYSQKGHALVALECFEQMQHKGFNPDSVIYSCVLKACGSVGAIDQGKLIHKQIIESGLGSDVVIGTALVDMYAKTASLEQACRVFNEMPNRNVVSWNVMIEGYVQHGNAVGALQHYQKMQHEGIKPDKTTYLCTLKACGSIGAIRQGKLIHEEIMSNGLFDVVGNALIDMYAKCGSMVEACEVFDSLHSPNVVSWGSIIAGYAQHGNSMLVQRYFDDMCQQGVEPDSTIYMSILKACSHAGQVKEGQGYFKQMQVDHGIIPRIEHYNCMVDLLARAQLMNEAEELLEIMPILPDLSGWMSLLTACRTYHNVELGGRCFKQVVRLDPNNATGHVFMSNIYAKSNVWKGVNETEAHRRRAGVWKKPGRAWIEVHKKVHEFSPGDKSHTQTEEIYSKLKSLKVQMKSEGYVPDVDLVLKPMSDKHKEDSLFRHCEKLAIAFGLLSTPQGATIRVTKNLRVCADCHNATKIISKLEKRQIIISDTYCVHHFTDGICSCEKYH